jgi:hypothetical protein
MLPDQLRALLFKPVFTQDGMGVLNAKTQGCKGAKRCFPLGVLATLRLCVEMPFLSLRSAIRGSIPLVMLFAPFRGKSIQIIDHEQLAANRASCQTRPIKANQA